jgi:hypothetical protein
MIGMIDGLDSVRDTWTKEMDELEMQTDEPWNDGDGTNLNFWNGNEMGWNEWVVIMHGQGVMHSVFFLANQVLRCIPRDGKRLDTQAIYMFHCRSLVL